MSNALILRLFLAASLALSGACAPAAPPTATAQTGPALPAGWAFPASLLAPTLATGGMVVSTDRVASEIGAEILRRGGNAVDAAIATHFALAVVNPEAGNIGGGGFLIARMGRDSLVALDFRERAPAAATRDMFLDAAGNPTDASLVGHRAAGVPGSVAGMWTAHQRWGTLPWSDLLAPAVTLAEGLVVHPRLGESLRAYQERLRRYPAT
ncbi:MAG: gamma-glutamyltransferase, partial [Gemmatimonadota bacterium]|nr:gamma-glutamyltransferase [Gemmatimonadota bacterium]